MITLLAANKTNDGAMHVRYSMNSKQMSLSLIPCLRCGTCCSKFDVRVTGEEAEIICERIGITREEWINSYIDKRWPGTDSFILKRINKRCTFLKQNDDQNLCSIHSFKPGLCVEWEGGIHRAECRDGLQRRWGITVDHDGNLIGTLATLQRFRAFVESIQNH